MGEGSRFQRVGRRDGPRARQARSAVTWEEAWAKAEKTFGSSGAEAPREERR